MTKASPTNRSPSFRAASDELDGILDAIETGTADVDVLSEKVERAAELIRICRDKLAGTELRVKKVVDELAAETAAGSEDPTDDDPTEAG